MNRSSVVLALCFVLFAPGPLTRAQEEDPSPSSSIPDDEFDLMLQDADSLASVNLATTSPSKLTWYSMFTNVPGDWVETGGSAFRDGGLPVMGGIALATGALLLADHQTYAFTHDFYLRYSGYKFGANQLVRAGDGKTTIGIAAAFALYGFVQGDTRALRTASGTVEAMLASGIAVQILKRISGRESPQIVSGGNGHWHPFPGLRAYDRNQPRYYAFPSGHITTAMATLTVIAENYPDEHWIRPVGYSLVGLTGISLVSKGWHWYSDFPLAIALGYTFGRIAAHHDDGARPESAGGTPGASLRVFPSLRPEGPGVMLALNF